MRIEDITKIFDNGYSTYNAGYTGNTSNRSFTWDTSTAPKESYINVIGNAGSNDSVISYTKVASQDSLEVMEKRINDLEKQMSMMRDGYEEKISELERKIKLLSDKDILKDVKENDKTFIEFFDNLDE